MLVTDSQVHLWELDRPDRLWPQPPRNTPQREGGFSAEEALAEMDAAGVDRAIVVPPTWVGENNSTALEAAAKYPQRFAVMGRFDFAAPDRDGRLERWLEQPGMLGIRLTFFATPTAEQLDDGSLDWFWAACERLGIPLMLAMGGMAEKTARIAQRHPNLTLVLDHMALSPAVEGGELAERAAATVALGVHPNVCVKVSSVPSYSADAYPHRDIQPLLHRLYDAYGAHRLLWGSDLTRLKGSYADCRRLFAEDLDFLSPDDRELILGKALAEKLHWSEK